MSLLLFRSALTAFDRETLACDMTSSMSLLSTPVSSTYTNTKLRNDSLHHLKRLKGKDTVHSSIMFSACISLWLDITAQLSASVDMLGKVLSSSQAILKLFPHSVHFNRVTMYKYCNCLNWDEIFILLQTHVGDKECNFRNLSMWYQNSSF